MHKLKTTCKAFSFLERFEQERAKRLKEFYTLKVGQRFQECDSRRTRVVEIIGFVEDRVKIKTVLHVIFATKWSPLRVAPVGRITTARRDRFNRKSHGYSRLTGHCQECQIARGAVLPRGGLFGVTIMRGVCVGCLKLNSALIPDCDFNWPKEGKKAIFD